MKTFKLFVSLFGMALFCACSENDLQNVNNGTVEKESQYMAVEIISPSTAKTKATTEPGKNDFEEGLDTPDENKVNSLRFYFFDAEGTVSITASNKNFLDVTPIPSEEEGDNMPNVEQKLKAVIVISPENKSKVNSMLAVANFDNAELTDNKDYSRNELAKLSGDYSSIYKEDPKTANFMMTSSTYADANGQVTRSYIKPENLCAKEDEALKNPVKIYIERVVAKVKLNTKWNTTGKSASEGQKTIPAMETVENVRYNNKEGYTAVKAKDKDGNAITNSNGKNVYILFTNWDVTGKANKSYLIKKVNSTSAWSTLNGLWFWNHPAYYRSYWAVNPEDVKLIYGKHTDIKQNFGESTYCQENAADDFTDGSKSSYNPANETSNRTQAIIAATLVTLDAEKNATPISLAKWAGAEYTEDGVKAQMLALVTQDIYVKEVEGEGESQIVKYRTITEEEVELVTATEAGKADDKTEESERYLSYLKLTANASKQVYYKDRDGKEQYKDSNAVNEYLCDMPGAKIWHDGLTYYYTDIKHLGQEANNTGYGYYGVVRNHIYNITIESVTGLGTPVLDEDENIIPQHPQEDQDTYVAAQIHILSWRIVNNNVDLEW